MAASQLASTAQARVRDNRDHIRVEWKLVTPTPFPDCDCVEGPKLSDTCEYMVVCTDQSENQKNIIKIYALNPEPRLIHTIRVPAKRIGQSFVGSECALLSSHDTVDTHRDDNSDSISNVVDEDFSSVDSAAGNLTARQLSDQAGYELKYVVLCEDCFVCVTMDDGRKLLYRFDESNLWCHELRFAEDHPRYAILDFGSSSVPKEGGLIKKNIIAGTRDRQSVCFYDVTFDPKDEIIVPIFRKQFTASEIISNGDYMICFFEGKATVVNHATNSPVLEGVDFPIESVTDWMMDRDGNFTLLMEHQLVKGTLQIAPNARDTPRLTFQTYRYSPFSTPILGQEANFDSFLISPSGNGHSSHILVVSDLRLIVVYALQYDAQSGNTEVTRLRISAVSDHLQLARDTFFGADFGAMLSIKRSRILLSTRSGDCILVDLLFRERRQIFACLNAALGTRGQKLPNELWKRVMDMIKYTHLLESQ